jgi:hypothetical protein
MWQKKIRGDNKEIWGFFSDRNNYTHDKKRRFKSVRKLKIMKKYTIEEFKQGKKAVLIEDRHQWAKLNTKHELCLYQGHQYYSNDGKWTDDKLDAEKKGYTMLDFSQLVFEEEFPNKWCIHGSQELHIWHEEQALKTNVWGDVERFIYWRPTGSMSWEYNKDGEIPDGYSLISFDQFKQYVLKQPKMEKEIIGYKLKKKEYNSAVNAIVGFQYDSLDKNKTDHCGESLTKELREAGVLDLWFEPVYREDKKLPVINGKEGSYKKGDSCVVYGNDCAHISWRMLKDVFESSNVIGNRKIKSITLDSGVSITMEQIGEILEYVKFVNEQ